MPTRMTHDIIYVHVSITEADSDKRYKISDITYYRVTIQV